MERSYGLLCCHLFSQILWLLTSVWVPLPFPAFMTEASRASAFLRQQVLIQAVHVWGCFRGGCFVCAGPRGLGEAVLGTCWLWWETSEGRVGVEQPDTLPWLLGACVQESSPAGVGSPAGVVSHFNLLSAIPHCVALSHTSRNGKNLTFLLLWAFFFSCSIFRFGKPLEGLGHQEKRGRQQPWLCSPATSPGPLLPLEWRISPFWEVTSQWRPPKLPILTFHLKERLNEFSEGD